jgi:hypothetical protein
MTSALLPQHVLMCLQPRLADVLVKAALIKMRAMMFGKGSPPKQDRPSARLFEECLVLLTLINRYEGHRANATPH